MLIWDNSAERLSLSPWPAGNMDTKTILTPYKLLKHHEYSVKPNNIDFRNNTIRDRDERNTIRKGSGRRLRASPKSTGTAHSRCTMAYRHAAQQHKMEEHAPGPCGNDRPDLDAKCMYRPPGTTLHTPKTCPTGLRRCRPVHATLSGACGVANSRANVARTVYPVPIPTAHRQAGHHHEVLRTQDKNIINF